MLLIDLLSIIFCAIIEISLLVYLIVNFLNSELPFSERFVILKHQVKTICIVASIISCLLVLLGIAQKIIGYKFDNNVIKANSSKSLLLGSITFLLILFSIVVQFAVGALFAV